MPNFSIGRWLLHPKRDGLFLALGFLAVYEVLRQQVLYGDAYHMVPEAYGEKWEHGQHLLYLPIVQVLRQTVGEWFGLSTFEVMSHLSPVATALGVWFTHKGFRTLRLDRPRTALATALCGATPGVLFFATVAEIHAPFFAAAGLAFWMMAVLAVKPGFWRGTALGLATGLSALTHLSGVLMPLPFVLAAWAAGRASAREEDHCRRLQDFVPSALGTGLGHALLLGLPFGLKEAGVPRIALTFDSAKNYVTQYTEVRSPDLWHDLLETLQNEWVFALMPLSIAFLVAFEFPRLRPLATVMVLGSLPYFVATFLMLRGHDEHGAYFFTFPFLLAWLAVASLPRLAGLLLLIVSLGFALHDVRENDDPARPRLPARQLERAFPDREFGLLIGGLQDTEMWAIERASDKALYLPLYIFAGKEAFVGLLPNLDAILEEWFDDDRVVILTPDLITLAQPGMLGQGGSEVLREVLLPYLKMRYETINLPSDGYGGWEIRPKD